MTITARLFFAQQLAICKYLVPSILLQLKQFSNNSIAKKVTANHKEEDLKCISFFRSFFIAV
jgi:hypothetical protein